MNTPMTVTELQEVLRLHASWLESAEDGKRADLWRADLQEANLRGADLQEANLQEANLRGADLQEANLQEANLRGANLRGANLRGANLIYIGQDIRGYLFWAFKNDDDVVVIRAGCREFTGIVAARAHWESRHSEDDVLHADCLSLIDRCEKMALVRGWQLESETEAVAV